MGQFIATKGAIVMHKTNQEKRQVRRYCCSNPNCKTFFSRPKIIKYDLCPTCQTVVEMTTIEGQIVKAEEQVPRKKSVKKKTERKEVEKLKQFQSQEPTPMETARSGQLTISEEEVDAPSDSRCKHYFGYLGQREKGEGIPDTCLECLKSLDCMLSDYNKSTKTVEEIKKWYPAPSNYWI